MDRKIFDHRAYSSNKFVYQAVLTENICSYPHVDQNYSFH